LKYGTPTNCGVWFLLLIAPEGIEIWYRRCRRAAGYKLLIAPEGIEIKKEIRITATETKLLIAPEGIEIRF